MYSKAPAYIPGDHYIYCDRCGFKIRRSEARKTWDGLMVCSQDWEPRHPQDLIKARGDRQTVKDARPEPEHVFITTQITPDDL